MATGSVLITPREAANFLRLHVSTVYRLIESRQLPALRIGRGIRIDLRSLDQTLGRNRVSSPPSPTPPHTTTKGSA